jgi:hypothetical protein
LNSPNSKSTVFAAFALLLVVVSVPLFSTILPPLIDYPNHLARLHLIAEGGNEFYAVRWAPLPDLAADLVVPALARTMPLALAGKLFLVLTFALVAGGALSLNRVVAGSWRAWPLLAFGLLYSRILLWGFINYLFGVGVALCGLALWLALDERPAWLRVSASSLVALACFFSHIAAFGVYALAIAGVELLPLSGELRARRFASTARRLAIDAVQFVLPAILLFGFQPPGEGGTISYGPFWRKADLLFSVFDNYNRPFDIACFLLLIALLAGLVWTRRLRVAPRLAAALAVLSAAYLALPSQMLSGSGVDRRLPVVLFAVLIAAAAAPSLPRRAALTIGAAAAAVFLARMAVIEAVWLEADRVYAADIAAIDRLPPGAMLAVAYPPRDVNAGGIPQLHVAALAAARREAFVPTVFAYATQQPLALRPRYDALAREASPAALWAAFADGDAAARREVAVALQSYDFIVLVDREPIAVAPLPCLEALPSPARFRLFALRRRACF